MPIPQNGAFKNPYGPLISFQDQNILPPSAIYVGPNDYILLQIRNPTVSANFQVSYRMLRPDGELITTNNTYTVAPSAGNAEYIFLPPAEGFLLSMAFSGFNVSRGQLFVKVILTPEGNLPTANLAHLVLQGYVSNDDRLGFPQSPTESSLNGRGWLRDIFAGPATGTALTVNVPAGVHWVIRAVTFRLARDPAAGAGNVYLSLVDNNGQTTAICPAPATIAAGTSETFTFAPGMGVTTSPKAQSQGFPYDLIVPPNWAISASVETAAANDVFNVMMITVEEWVGL